MERGGGGGELVVGCLASQQHASVSHVREKEGGRDRQTETDRQRINMEILPVGIQSSLADRQLTWR